MCNNIIGIVRGRCIVTYRPLTTSGPHCPCYRIPFHLRTRHLFTTIEICMLAVTRSKSRQNAAISCMSDFCISLTPLHTSVSECRVECLVAYYARYSGSCTRAGTSSVADYAQCSVIVQTSFRVWLVVKFERVTWESNG
jgi:hypothetical protein